MLIACPRFIRDSCNARKSNKIREFGGGNDLRPGDYSRGKVNNTCVTHNQSAELKFLGISKNEPLNANIHANLNILQRFSCKDY